MNVWTLLLLLGVAVWWYKPLRVFLVERTNRTVKVLLVVFPSLTVGRLAYRVYKGEQDSADVVTLTVLALLVLWIFLVWLSNYLDRRRPTKARAPDLAPLSRLPGVPRVPPAVTSPEVQRAARMAADAASRVDWQDVAGSLGRSSGRWVGRLKKNLASGSDTK